MLSEAHWKLHFTHCSGNFLKLTTETKGGKSVDKPTGITDSMLGPLGNLKSEGKEKK